MAEGIVLDASTMLVVLYGEPGQAEARRRLEEAGTRAYASAVNISEVASKLAEAGFEEAEVREAVSALGLTVSPFDEKAAFAAGMLRAETRERGLSLGDRACLALARDLGLPALTTDTAWDGLAGAEILTRAKEKPDRGQGR